MLWFGKKKNGRRYVYTTTNPVAIGYVLIFLLGIAFALLSALR